jgi:hypothetical protein
LLPAARVVGEQLSQVYVAHFRVVGLECTPGGTLGGIRRHGGLSVP